MSPGLLLPEYIICAGIVLLLLREAFSGHAGSRHMTTWITLITLALAAISIVPLMKMAATTAFFGLAAVDPFSGFIKLVVILAAITSALMIARSSDFDRGYTELFTMLLTVTFGCFLMASARNLLMFYLGMETASILSYLLAGIKKHDEKSNEAALKYVIYGSLASAVMIFGMSYLYGVTGSLEYSAIHQALTTKAMSTEVLWLSLALMFAGFGYKVSAAPFHMWTPDVYEGSPLPITAFFSVAPKAAGVAGFCRLLFSVFSQWDAATSAIEPLKSISWGGALAVIAVITMFVGNLAALQQSNIKRLMAYSSISHAGFLLLALSAQSTQGLTAMLYYVLIYYLMNMGAFWISLDVCKAAGTENMDAFRGLGVKAPALAVFMMVFLFALTGLPPFSGFMAKWYVFAAVIQKGMYTVATVAVVNTVIALVYYARIVRLMFFDKPVGTTASGAMVLSTSDLLIPVVLAVPTVALGLYWEPVYKMTKAAIAMFGIN